MILENRALVKASQEDTEDCSSRLLNIFQQHTLLAKTRRHQNMTITVIVDDSDPEIAYGGFWTKTQPSALSFSGIEQSVANTLHVASGGQDESSMSYNFSGNFCLCSDWLESIRNFI